MAEVYEKNALGEYNDLAWNFPWEETAEEKMKKKIEAEGYLAVKAPPPKEREEKAGKTGHDWLFEAEKKAVAEKKAEGKPLPKKYQDQIDAAKAKDKKKKKKDKKAGKKDVVIEETVEVPAYKPGLPMAAIIDWKKIGLYGGVGLSVLGTIAYFVMSRKKKAA